MSLVRAARVARGSQVYSEDGRIPSRSGVRVGWTQVDQDSALRQSSVMACLRLRADQISTMPVRTFRDVGGVAVRVADPALFDMPGGPGVGWPQWMFSSQVDIDRCGNAIGIITERDGNGLPKTVELQDSKNIIIRGVGSQISEYVIGGTTYKSEHIWHERGFTLSGKPLGISAIAYGAMTIGGYLSAQEYALNWFSMGPHPKGTLKNTMLPRLSRDKIDSAREVFRETAMAGDIFVTGNEWEYTPEQQASASQVFIEEMKYGAADVCRFLGVPADMIDAGTGGSNITYANVTQKNLQFLTLHLQPAIARREWYLSRYAVSNPRKIRLNTRALLRLDPETSTRVINSQVSARLLSPSEARALDDREPLSTEQIQEFIDLGYVSRVPDPKPVEGAPK